MLHSKRYLYVGFMCHQTIEKILKAYIAGHKTQAPPFTHSLSHLTRKAGLDHEFDEAQKSFIDVLEPLNIEARYPVHKERLLKSLSYDRCVAILNKTEELQQWIKRRL